MKRRSCLYYTCDVGLTCLTCAQMGCRQACRFKVKVKSSQVKSSQVKSSQVKSSQVKSSQVKSSHVMSCHVMSCHVMSCHVMSCHVMSCHVSQSGLDALRRALSGRRRYTLHTLHAHWQQKTKNVLKCCFQTSQFCAATSHEPSLGNDSVMSCRVMSCRVLSCLVVSCDVM